MVITIVFFHPLQNPMTTKSPINSESSMGLLTKVLLSFPLNQFTSLDFDLILGYVQFVAAVRATNSF